MDSAPGALDSILIPLYASIGGTNAGLFRFQASGGAGNEQKGIVMKTPIALTAALMVGGMIAGSGIALAQDAVITEIPPPVREYVITHPVDPVIIEGEVVEGYVIPEDIELQPVPEMPQYGYIYVNDQPVIVELDNRRVIYLQE